MGKWAHASKLSHRSRTKDSNLSPLFWDPVFLLSDYATLARIEITFPPLRYHDSERHLQISCIIFTGFLCTCVNTKPVADSLGGCLFCDPSFITSSCDVDESLILNPWQSFFSFPSYHFETHTMGKIELLILMIMMNASCMKIDL